MIITDKTQNLTMSQKLKMFRLINKLSQEELGQKLNVSDKTISAWENGERDINLSNAQLICEFFNIPNAYFVFNENYEKVDSSIKVKIEDYLKNYEFTKNIETIIDTCKQKITDDGLQFKKEYIPYFDFDKQDFISYGIFDKSSLPIKIDHHTGISIFDCYHRVNFDIANLTNINQYKYSSAALSKFGLFDILDRFNSDTIELTDLTDCNNLETFKNTLSKMRNKDYTKKKCFWQ